MDALCYSNRRKSRTLAVKYLDIVAWAVLEVTGHVIPGSFPRLRKRCSAARAPALAKARREISGHAIRLVVDTSFKLTNPRSAGR
jgi:hypothetical protein